jgi:hypothetical protein
LTIASKARGHYALQVGELTGRVRMATQVIAEDNVLAPQKTVFLDQVQVASG